MIYQDTMGLLEKALCVNLVKNFIDQFLAGPASFAQMVEVVVGQIVSALSMKKKVIIANLRLEEIETLQYALDLYISSRLETAAACDIGNTRLNAERTYTIIMETLWNRLQETHKLKVVK